MVICTTTFVILVTIFVQGSLTESFVKFLGIKINVDATSFLAELDNGEKEIKDYDFERKYLYPLIIGKSKVTRNIEIDQSSGGGSQQYYDDNDDQSIDGGKSIESGSKISTFSTNKKLLKFQSSNRKEFFPSKNNFEQQFNPLTLELEDELFRLTRENLSDYEEFEESGKSDLWDYGKS